MPTWFWLNIPLAALFFLLWVGVPTYMVIKWPDQDRPSDRRPSPGERVPVRTAGSAETANAPSQIPRFQEGKS